MLAQIARAWRERRDELVSAGDRVTEQLRKLCFSVWRNRRAQLRNFFDSGYSPLRRTFDRSIRRLRFRAEVSAARCAAITCCANTPQSGNEEALEMVTQTLRAMAAGGMNDQLGGGFHRYSVDRPVVCSAF